MKNKLVSRRKQGELMRAEYGEHPFDRLYREIDNLLDVCYRGFERHDWRLAESPGFEVSETDDEIRVKAELPGMDEKDIEVTLDDDVLTIRGERNEQHEEKKRSYQISEMSRGSFYRTIPLQAAIDRDKVKARFKRGVLTLTLPKTEQAKSERKRIPISTG